MSEILKHLQQIRQQIVKNPSQIMNKCDSKASLDWFWRQVATRSALRCPPWIKGLSIWSLFGPIWRAKVPFLEPPWVQNVLKIKLLSLGQHVDPPKMVSMSGFGKHMNIYWKIDAKIEVFGWLRTTFGVILFAYNTFSQFSVKSRN